MFLYMKKEQLPDFSWQSLLIVIINPPMPSDLHVSEPCSRRWVSAAIHLRSPLGGMSAVWQFRSPVKQPLVQNNEKPQRTSQGIVIIDRTEAKVNVKTLLFVGFLRIALH